MRRGGISSPVSTLFHSCPLTAGHFAGVVSLRDGRPFLFGAPHVAVVAALRASLLRDGYGRQNG
jgi:hypothetical protein